MEKYITVINQTPMKVYAQTKGELYEFEPFESEQNIKDLTIDEIDYLNKNTFLFKEGYLTVEDSIKDEVFTAIGLKNYQDIISREEIIDAIEYPTNEKIQRLINIESLSAFRRVRVELVGLLSITNDISNRIISIINQRYDELSMIQIKSNIVISVPTKSKAETKLINEIAELKAQMAELLKAQGGKTEPTKEVVDEVTEYKTLEETTPEIVEETKKTTDKKATTRKK